MKKKFATVFNNFESVHLTKDVGMIPCSFSSLDNYDKSIIFYWDKEKEKEKIELQDVILHPIKAKTRLFYYLKLFQDISKNNVSVLNIYHDSIQSALFCYLAKLIGVKVYLKLDISHIGCDILLKRSKSKRIFDYFRLKGLNLANFVSVETWDTFKKLKDNRVFKKDIFYHIPNSILDSTVKAEPLPYLERSNRIIVVGRIGAYPKNHELILDALSKIESLKGWFVDFIGPIDDSFNKKIDSFYRNNKRHSKVVRFLGNKSRDELMDLYATSKIFLLSSRWEGFSLALVEAAYFGCYIITTEVGGSNEVTDRGKYGKIYKQDELVGILGHIDESYISSGYIDRLKYARDIFNINKYSGFISKSLG
ncbi:glycosyltransferase family 4 protein [Vibrio fluvialis]|uniref:glycosyltransferase family 4 protein n=1 Tax=Vibrio sp. bablab_jr001 TaxID=2755067 RepID=UPI0018F21FBD|nr:glycosyltransferase family 4 protein [Vibrio sp. bablab_jr001]MBY7825783.1 glycosyltransferase family 4 protein [Vibrio fluvialis]MBY8254301.1 glycosyltransferase family 4 protein [Vibrio fluvialis]